MTPVPSPDRPEFYLIVAALLMAIGIFGLLRRRTLIGMLISGELIFSAASLNLMAFNRFKAPDPTCSSWGWRRQKLPSP